MHSLSETIGETLGYSNICVSDEGEDTCSGPLRDSLDVITMHTFAAARLVTKSDK